MDEWPSTYERLELGILIILHGTISAPRRSVQAFNQPYPSSSAPLHVQAFNPPVSPSPAGHEGDVGLFVTDLFEKDRHLFHYFVVSFLLPVHGVEFIDGDDNLLDSQRADEQSVLARLAAGVVTGLELAASGVDDHDGCVRLRSA